MSNDIAKTTTHQLDAFDGFNEAIEGSDTQPQSSVSVLGLKLKYLDPRWTDPDEREIKDLLVVHDVQRKVQKWLDDSRPADTIVIAPGQPWPNIEQMNAECPQTEWREKFGKLQGPWQGEHVVCFFDPKSMVRYWWPSPTSTIPPLTSGASVSPSAAAAQDNPLGMQSVPPLTAKEVTRDRIPY